MKGFKKILKGFETAMVAVAFAEEGEQETARRLMLEEGLFDEKAKPVDKIYTSGLITGASRSK